MQLGPDGLAALARTGEGAAAGPALAPAAREAFALATRHMYTLSTAFVALGWLATLFVPAIPLRTTFEATPGRGTQIGAAEGQETIPVANQAA